MPRPLIPHRRERILDAAEHLVLSQGFVEMSVAAVAERAGIAKGAIYLEFASKRDLREALLRRGADRMSAAVAAQLTEEPPALSRAYRVTVRALLAEPLMVAAFLDDEGVLGAHADGVTDDRFRRHHTMIVDWIADLQRRGRFDSTVSPEHLGLTLSSATVGLLSAARRFGPISPAQLEGALSTLADLISFLEIPAADGTLENGSSA